MATNKHRVTTPLAGNRVEFIMVGTIRVSLNLKNFSLPFSTKRNSDTAKPKPASSFRVNQFDIFFNGKRYAPQEKNKEICIEGEKERMILRPGMVLLKKFLTHDEQVEIVKICRELGLGPGGFYRPSYENGAKLRLHMMCLGLDWDPQTGKYGNKRLVDGSNPPSIPERFRKLVVKAIQEAQYLIRKECRVSYAERILPSMSPDICIVNFYNNYGRLGLHKDRDETPESIQKGLPVVSFSIGDSAEFIYGDHRDVDKAENAVLDSGDVVIFGGVSRLIFHGVSSIIPNSAPKKLLQDIMLSPGRLNLTFRQY
ncbi:hypothetical protein HN51_048442 [Arachis hypogaea]|uniref:DNA N(6)-methyladenine demethylase n=1 Tax=Arachis hypogaea TaxID=3818 RepID=A0A445AL21_ARAHY|nr:alpha-ketoglutarate-dependent dioxygenase abh1 isoform X2 [Arachis ipaensis]XP_025633927.1 alpha-ketoglutarate-dependent dioxygenase abh1 isoform X2 [Arachis hypogaea]QHO24967.1 uncharacterized protein DS421_12g376990 [Arachis hypogaea]RYR27146.1 hypothetical protein Ahy_B02g061480 [Arachis hypogaea]